MLREDVDRYTKLTGEDGWHVPIMKLGAYLDGYDKGLEVLDKIRAEIESCREDVEPHLVDYRYHRNEGLNMALDIIDKYKEESEG